MSFTIYYINAKKKKRKKTEKILKEDNEVIQYNTL